LTCAGDCRQSDRRTA